MLLICSVLIFSCGPNQSEIEKTIDDKFKKLILTYPTATPITIPAPLPTATPITIPTPLPTATPITIPTPPAPLPTATPITMLELEEDIRNLLKNPYATPAVNTGLDINVIYEKYRKSVVLIEHGSSVGTGWAISEDYIVTNEHVITSANSVDIFIPSDDGKIVKKSGLVKSWDENADLAFIKSVNHGAIPLKVKSLTSEDAGTAVIQIGYSTGVTNYPAARHGIVVSVFNQMGTAGQYGSAQKYQKLNGVNYSKDLFPVVVVNTGADPGDSGGPIIDYEGNVVGVIYAQVQSVGGKRIIGQQLAVGIEKLDSYWESCNGIGGSCD